MQYFDTALSIIKNLSPRLAFLRGIFGDIRQFKIADKNRLMIVATTITSGVICDNYEIIKQVFLYVYEIVLCAFRNSA